MDFSRRKVLFLLSLFQIFTTKKPKLLFSPVVLFGIASQSSQSRFFAGIQEYYTRH